MNVDVGERESGEGISGGGGNRISSGPLAGVIESIDIYRKNLFARNKKYSASMKNYYEGGASTAIKIQMSRTPGTLVHGNQPEITVERVTAGIEHSRPFRPNWNGTARLVIERAGARDEKGNPIVRDFFGTPLTASGNSHDSMYLAKLKTVYGDPAGSSMCVLKMDQGIPFSPGWLVFNRVNARGRQSFAVGPARFLFGLSGGHVVGKFPPHEAFPIGGTDSIRGYEEGGVGSGRSYVVGSGEISFPVMGALGLGGVIFADYGSDLGSGPTVPGDPRNKRGSGYGYGVGIRVESPLGPVRLEYALNEQRTGRFHFGIGLRK